MHLELTEILTCPRCGPGHGMIAFVEAMEDRRIVTGRLDCPSCEERHRIRGGRVLLSGSGARGPDNAPNLDGSDAAGALDGIADPGATAAALLGPPGEGEILLLAGGVETLGPEIARLRETAAVVTFGAGSPADRRVHPVVPGDGPIRTLPFRTSSVHGAVTTGTGPRIEPELSRILRPGGRLVVLGPTPGTPAPDADLEELARDERAWVGRKPPV